MMVCPRISLALGVLGSLALLTACSGGRVNEELPDDELSGDDLPGDELPGDELPGDELPGDELPGDELPEPTDDPIVLAALRINEVAAAGDPTDWVELINIGDETIGLAGVFLTDDPNVLDKAAAPPETTIAPGALLVLEIDDATVGFKIGSDEEFHLVTSAGTIIDSANWDEGASPAGGSFGRIPDGTGGFTTLPVATRGEANIAAPSDPAP